MQRRILILVVFVSIGFAIFMTKQFSNHMQPDQSIIIATGSDAGMYSEFGGVLASNSSLPIKLQGTTGSIENLDLLRSGKVDYALVQNDLGQYSYLGIRGQEKFENLSYIIPVFPEYVQVILPKNSDITVLSQLSGRRVCIGDNGSGTYFNSIDILQDAGLRETVDFFPVNSSPFECIKAVEAGEKIDAIFLTSNRKIAAENSAFKQLLFSSSIAEALSQKFPYFRVDEITNAQGVIEIQLVVDAFLATNSDQLNDSVQQVSREIVKNWSRYQKSILTLPDISTKVETGTVPYHQEADATLVNAGLKQVNYWTWILGLPWMFLLFLCLIAERAKTSYNRMGESPIAQARYYFMVKFVGRFSQFFIGITVLVVGIAAAIFALRLTEDYYAQQSGTVSPFALMTFEDSLVWLFTYISSGFTSDNVYPISFLGKLIAAVLALAGVIAPVAGVIYLINKTHEKAQLRHQGLISSELRFTGHTIICGWNEKAPGIIYSLTGEDVDERKNVVIIANIEEQYPLEKYNLNSSYVTYCKGRPSDIAMLKKANVQDADAVIILADFDGDETHNKGSILCAMNVRKENPLVHICAEIEYLDNIDYFTASGCSALLYPALLATRMAAATILSPQILDYVFDMVTYHKRDSLYSKRASDLFAGKVPSGHLIRQLEIDMLRRGVNVVGVIDGNQKTSLYDAAFETNNQSHSLLNEADSSKVLQEDSVIIYSARRAKHILRDQKNSGEFEPLTKSKFQIEYPDNLSVLVVGDAEALTSIKINLGSIVKDLNFLGIDLENDNIRYIDELREYACKKFDKIVILTGQKKRASLVSIDDLDGIDTDLMLTTSLFRKAFDKCENPPEIICEIANMNNRELILNAGANHVLPTVQMASRFLTKEAYDKNHITDFLMAAMNLEDGVHLHCHIVSIDDGFEGERYDQILATQINGIRILAWRPVSQTENLRNKQGDFGFHYRTVIDHRIVSSIAREGDVLILLIKRQPEYWSSNTIPERPSVQKVMSEFQ